MRHHQTTLLSRDSWPRLCVALRETLKKGYDVTDLHADLMAGIIVGIVAIPLGMALAIASGVAPQYGLYTVIIAGSTVALLGGSRFQVTGPTAAFVVILVPISQKFGLGGLLVAGLMAGIMLMLLGIARMGRLIQFIPAPVTTGFTAGIAVVIATLQIKDFLGLHIHEMPERYVGKVVALVHAVDTASWSAFFIGAITLTILLGWPYVNKRIPAPLIALITASGIAALLSYLIPTFTVATIGSTFTYMIDGITGYGIPSTPPRWMLPWHMPGPSGSLSWFSFDMLETLLPHACAIAMLGAIESLLSAVVADGMTQTKHDPDAELIALGIGNIVCPFFGGIAATGAIARTATNIRFGARSPLAAVIHALFTCVVIVFLAPYVAYLPMASLAALLLLVAYTMSDVRHFVNILKIAPKGDVIVMLTCFLLTVVFDMVLGVAVGVVLAALVFMQRMAASTTSRMLTEEHHPLIKKPLSHNVVVYEIAGPLFFGAAEQAIEALESITDSVTTVIFVMNSVPIMDITGFIAFKSAIKHLTSRKQRVILVGMHQQPATLLASSGLLESSPLIEVYVHLDDALATITSPRS